MIDFGGVIASPRTKHVYIGADVLLRGTISTTPVVITDEVTPTRYAIELRDKDGNLKARLENIATGLRWEWNRKGGCGRCVFVIQGDYLQVDVQPDDDLRVYMPTSATAARLVYRGYVEAATPEIAGGSEGSIRVEAMGYFGMLARIIVNDEGSIATYSNQDVGLTVQSIIDDFVVANTDITRGTIDEGGFTPDTLEFKVSVREALETCADLLGAVEYGVDENLEFFWYNQVDTLRGKFYFGGNITKLTDLNDFRRIQNYIFFEGGEVDGAALEVQGSADDSITRYGRHEVVVQNGSVVTNIVAQQLISSLLSQSARPSRQLSIRLVNTTLRFEDTLPLGRYAVIDPDATQARYLWGTTANGGDNKIWGKAANGGSHILWGGIRKEQIDRISYTVSPEDGKWDAEVQFGSSVGFSRSSATIKQLQQIQSALRQRSL